LPVISTLDELDKAMLMEVLVSPRNSITKQVMKLFRMQGHEIEFSTDGLEKIAEMAIKSETGARGLRGIVEKLMLDTQFELPSLEQPHRFTVDADVVTGTKPLTENCNELTAKPEKGAA